MNTSVGTVDLVETFVVRVWLPDRPGALGQVASQIGALGGDVVGIDILERGGGRAVDDLVVSVPNPGLVDLLVAEIAAVDGVAVEAVRQVANDRPDRGLVALEIAAELAEAPVGARLHLLADRLAALVDAEWTAVLDAATTFVVAGRGDPPDLAWLAAFLDGSRHLDEAAQAAGAPGDLAWAWLGGVDSLTGRDLVVAAGREGRPFHARERTQLGLLCRTATALLSAVACA